MKRYHHLGIPTLVRREGETYLEQFRVHVSGYESSPYGIEWMRFEPEALVPDLVRSVPHVAFIVADGAPVEFLYFEPSHGTAPVPWVFLSFRAPRAHGTTTVPWLQG